MNFKLTRKYIVLFAVIGMVALAGCSFGDDGNNDSGEDLAEDTGTNIEDVDVGESFGFEMKMTEKNQEQLVKNQPPEGMDTSLERQNLKKRYEYLNDQNNQHYVYLMSHGKVVTWYTASGKVSSVNSKLTNDKQIVRADNCDFDEGNGAGGSEGACYKTVESPQMDGSYGTNGDAIFFFTTDGEYVQWNGEYIVSEQPLNIRTPPELTQEVNETDE